MRTLPTFSNGHNHFLIPATPATPAQPEAACSVNVFFEVEGYGRAQATGRGSTASEAATNLHATITATKQALEAPPVVSQEARLGALLTCGLKKAVTKQDWGLVERLTKAAALVLAEAVSPGEREGMLAVKSLTHPEQYYEVDGTACSCKDYEHRHAQGEKTFFCKHALAVLLYRRLETKGE